MVFYVIPAKTLASSNREENKITLIVTHNRNYAS
jgi:ABC-type lipoprotein export system ATPase subunit